MTFVELTATVLVDPNDVAATVSETATSTRVYLRGSGAAQYLLVDLPIAEVVSRLLAGPARRPKPSPRDDLLRARPSPRSQF